MNESMGFLEQTWQEAMTFVSQNVTPYIYNIIAALVIFFVGKWVVKHIARWLENMMKSRMDHIVAHFLSNILYVVFFVMVIIASLTQLGLNTTSLVAVLGAVGLAVGLSLKNSLGNLAAGVILIVLRPFRVGHYIEADGTSGIVKDIKIFATTLNTADNKVVTVPNGNIISGHIVNYSILPTRRVDLVIRVPYSADLSKVKSALMDIVDADERVLKDPAAVVVVSTLADSGVDINVRPWVKTEDYWPTRWDITEQIKNRFGDMQLGVPAQQLDVYVEKSAQAPAANS